ncbi:hypothetical protein Amet_2547 [Alkaliphilus metalliredigens QYMF]|uniref:2TM domain-containing protein n=1 Tax=Alkaliphilus metalliredigens (strain QYMF) TaxID=293826 RepID=A6TR82_ALKMQ|nr:hypothetical protein [Alkaliphilus metalliredigens]ABR48700.1 hypothetical protein Amet_2547 [Alkaliphilus metalliredigens QYMF]
MDHITDKELEKLIKQRRKQKKKNRFSKFMVTLVILLNTTFTVAVLYTFKNVGHEPTTLIAAWFAFTTGELWMLSSIKKSKVRKEDVQDEY